jgi:hypothetical protein
MATLNPIQIIRAVFGPEPRRDGEMPMTYMVGSKAFAESGPVTSIVERTQSLGDRDDELADVVTYLDILAFRCGVDLGAATMSKFNRVSERVGSDVWVDAEDWHRKS